MFFSNAVMWFIIATTASTLFVNGVHQIDSAPQAADALRPIGGDLARILFAAGILGTGFLGVPVLAGSGAYAVAETLKVREGLDLKLWQAPVFYGVIAVATVCGAAINLLGINPIQALYSSAVINGFVAPPLLVFIVLLGSSRRVMADKTNSPLSTTLGWLAVALMILAAAALVLTSF
jgi:Mn2+/Fe2+ NRAMP family transporter